MSFQNLAGGFAVPIGGGQPSILAAPTLGATVLDAADEACIMLGRIVTSDGASHTIDTSGSSSLQWRAGSVIFANAATTVVVGLAAVDAGAGPAGRAANAANVITFDVSRSMVGGGGGVVTGSWQTHVPTAGTKTIANGDLVAFAVQMTARGGADSVQVTYIGPSVGPNSPAVTSYTGGSYAATGGVPSLVIVFSDGALGWFYMGEVLNTTTTRTWNSGSATKEYGQLYQFPFPVRVCGLNGLLDPDNDCDIVLYSDPLGTPVAERTVSIDASTVQVATPRCFYLPFSSPYDVAANTPVGAVFKPGASNVSAYYKTMASAAHRITDPWGTSGYGISRAAGAFANANSSLDHYYIGLLASGFEAGGGGGLAAPLFGGAIL